MDSVGARCSWFLVRYDIILIHARSSSGVMAAPSTERSGDREAASSELAASKMAQVVSNPRTFARR
jgi:hypothetical protein